MAWMATVGVEETKEEKSVANVPVMREYLDVFPNDLSGLPLDRKVEFTIDLLPGTEPISIPPIGWHQLN